jgi:hypothetical protein
MRRTSVIDRSHHRHGTGDDTAKANIKVLCAGSATKGNCDTGARAGILTRTAGVAPIRSALISAGEVNLGVCRDQWNISGDEFRERFTGLLGRVRGLRRGFLDRVDPLGKSLRSDRWGSGLTSTVRIVAVGVRVKRAADRSRWSRLYRMSTTGGFKLLLLQRWNRIHSEWLAEPAQTSGAISIVG